MQNQTKQSVKLALIFCGMLFFVCLLLGRRGRTKEIPEGEGISRGDTAILLEAAGVELPEGWMGQEPQAALTYGQYLELVQPLDVPAGKLPDLSAKYEESYVLLKEDWYEAYAVMLAYLHPASTVWESEVFLLGVDAQTRQAYTEEGAMTAAYEYASAAFEDEVLRRVRVYIQDRRLLTVVGELPGEHTLQNVWIMESGDGLLQCFYRQTEFTASAAQEAQRESVADLVFRDGVVAEVREKQEKINGRLLWVSDDRMEIEGCGVYPIGEGLEVYRLYGSLETLRKADLRIGYADTDYVIDDGKICACLVSRRENADRIRVLIKNTATGGNYHDEVTFTVDGQKIRIAAADLQAGERRSYRCAALTDKVVIEAEGVKRQDIAYRGTVECCHDGTGMVLINELPLEEYLYAVVPSEMPASYPAEALKAQAVCARTYAYLYILHAGLPALGAHVDDSTSYQVYHNCTENAATTTAVKETEGLLLLRDGAPAQNYYYSTSCGAGTDASVWQSGDAAALPYLQALRLTQAGGAAEGLEDEETFRRFITTAHEEDLESGEPWYRWTYTVETLDADGLLERLRERYQANPQSVLTKAGDDYYVSEPVAGDAAEGGIRELAITGRGAGGVARELQIVTARAVYKVTGEYHIRYVLCDRQSEAVRQDGSTVTPAQLLPSGFFVIETGKEQGNVVSYTLTGGGYGHGVGMSQNAARAMGHNGASCEQILSFFFRGCVTGRPDGAEEG